MPNITMGYPQSTLRFGVWQKLASETGDAFGVLGVWPAAWVAAQRVPRLASVRCQWVVTRGGRKET